MHDLVWSESSIVRCVIVLNTVALRFDWTDASGVGLNHGDNFIFAFSIDEKFSVEVVIT
jgi:hypothetical protein